MGEANIAQYKPGDLLFNEGDPGDYMYIIMKGTIEIIKEGKGILAELGPGTLLGEMAIVDDQPRSATAKAKTEVVANRLNKDEVDRNLSKLPSWVNALFKTLSTRVRQMNERVSLESLDDDKLRILRQMVFIANKMGTESKGKIYLNIKVVRDKVFSTLGTPIEKIDAFIEELLAKDYLETGQGETIVIPSIGLIEEYMRFFQVKNALIKQLSVQSVSEYINSELCEVSAFIFDTATHSEKATKTGWGQMVQLEYLQKKYQFEKKKELPVSQISELSKIKLLFVKKNPYNHNYYVYINLKFMETFIDFQKMGLKFESELPSNQSPEVSESVSVPE